MQPNILTLLEPSAGCELFRMILYFISRERVLFRHFNHLTNSFYVSSIQNSIRSAPDPIGCNKNPDVECNSHGNYVVLLLLFSAGPLLVALIANLIFLAVIWWTEYTTSKIDHEKYLSSWQQSSASPNTSLPLSPLASRLSRPSKAAVQRRKEIVNRAIAYTVCFLLTYIPTLIYRLWNTPGFGVPFAITLASRIFFPLQGLFNVIIYTYPHAVSFRRNHDDCSWFLAFWEVVKSGGDSDVVKPRRRLLQKGSLRRRNSMRNEPVVQDLESILSSR